MAPKGQIPFFRFLLSHFRTVGLFFLKEKGEILNEKGEGFFLKGI